MDNNDAKLEKMEMTHENVAREAIEILEVGWPANTISLLLH